jgi:hypothetical protein
MDLAELKAKKRRAQEQLSKLPGVEGFGIGDGTIRVYVQSPQVKQSLPADVEGVTLEVVVTGDISAR